MSTDERLNRINTVVANRQLGAVVFEDITDPHNAAAVFRTCDAYGVQDVYLIFDKEPAFNPKKIGKASSSSANKWLTFHIFDSTKECLEVVSSKKHIIATAIDEDATSIFETDFTKPTTALLFGNETRGLTTTALSFADETVYIPMRGMVESLNLSVTAATCLFEMTRQRSIKNISAQLSLERQKELKNNFVQR